MHIKMGKHDVLALAFKLTIIAVFSSINIVWKERFIFKSGHLHAYASDMFGRWSINQHQCKYWGFFSLAKLMFHTAYEQAASHETSIGTGDGFVAVRVFALQTRLIHNRSSIRSTDVLESWQARCGMTRSHKPVKECEGWYAHASLCEHGGWLISVEYFRYPTFCRVRAISWTNLCAGVWLHLDIRTYGQKKNIRPDAP